MALRTALEAKEDVGASAGAGVTTGRMAAREACQGGDPPLPGAADLPRDLPFYLEWRNGGKLTRPPSPSRSPAHPPFSKGFSPTDSAEDPGFLCFPSKNFIILTTIALVRV